MILRNGTLFGYSPRMRFDLVVNIFGLYSTLHNRIGIFGDGEQWRPFLHVRDCARAFVFFAEKSDTRHVCYNIAHENLRVLDIADVFRRLNPRLEVQHIESPGHRPAQLPGLRAPDDRRGIYPAGRGGGRS